LARERSGRRATLGTVRGRGPPRKRWEGWSRNSFRRNQDTPFPRQTCHTPYPPSRQNRCKEPSEQTVYRCLDSLRSLDMTEDRHSQDAFVVHKTPSTRQKEGYTSLDMTEDCHSQDALVVHKTPSTRQFFATASSAPHHENIKLRAHSAH